ncbi:twin-arginine translocase subunit TatC [Bacillus sp. V3-13]|uniref:twin-arginine translocase subunit TatC n=1 Tax=Bacillus sp. V3-13 TaxID=2053728 RepID=UPI000C7812A8|nr:twin-arginine translocase subunit TatC [Bacillus sp. V3-13]PLR77937.1 twin-arginine translocase subunit TatC [Bacillus sp. V3-13]
MGTKNDMSISDHVEEVRKRIIYILISFVFFFIISFWLVDILLSWVKSSAVAKNITWNVFSPGDSLNIYLKAMFFMAITFTIPIAIYHLLAFLKPGMTREETVASFRYIPFSIFLLILGFLFSYFILFPSLINFTTIMNEKMEFEQTYGALQYYKFLFNTVIPVTILFQFPLVMLLLTSVGVVNPQKLAKSRRAAYFILIVISVIISPPDFISDFLVFIPLVLLFEVSVILSSWIYKRKPNLSVERSV